MSPQIEDVELSSLNTAYGVMIRAGCDDDTVQLYAEAMKAGAVFPPIRVCNKTRQIIDGFHRVAACRFLGIEVIKAQLETVTDDRDLFMRAVAANANHGRRYTTSDFRRIALRATQLGISVETVAGVLKVEAIRLKDIRPIVASGQPQKAGRPQQTETPEERWSADLRRELRRNYVFPQRLVLCRRRLMA